MDNNPLNPHPWEEFLNARKRAINWMHEQQKYSDKEIVFCLSMDEKQVYLIRTYEDRQNVQ
jgi:hypothetical protein